MNAKITCLLLPLLLTLSACTGSAMLMVNSVARLGDYQVFENIAYGEHRAQRLSIYSPGLNKPDKATIIFIYGGCWGACVTIDNNSYRFVADSLTELGYVVVLVDYRLYPEVRFGEIMEDASAATTWIQQNIQAYGGNPEQLFLMGHSAGAQMAALLVLNEDYLAAPVRAGIKGFIGLAGAYDFLPFDHAYQSRLFGPEKNYPLSQPINFVDGNEAPLLLLHGANDKTVLPSNLISLARVTKAKGGLVETHLYPKLTHVELIARFWRPLKNSTTILQDIDDFINRYKTLNNKANNNKANKS